MPSYVYRCKECGKAFEQVKSINDRVVTCECGSRLHPVPSVTAAAVWRGGKPSSRE